MYKSGGECVVKPVFQLQYRQADRNIGCLAEECVFFFGMWTGNVRPLSISGPPVNKQASCLGSLCCCSEIVWVG